MSPYRTPAPFTCPECGAQHDRGWVDGVETYRCLRCGYVGKDNRPRPPQPLTDEEFRSKLLALFDDRLGAGLGPLYINPMTTARIRKLFSSSYDIPLTIYGGLVGKLYGVELYQTVYIPDGWVYAPPGGDHEVLRRKPADPQYLLQFDPTAEPYIPPPVLPTWYDYLMMDDG